MKNIRKQFSHLPTGMVKGTMRNEKPQESKFSKVKWWASALGLVISLATIYAFVEPKILQPKIVVVAEVANFLDEGLYVKYEVKNVGLARAQDVYLKLQTTSKKDKIKLHFPVLNSVLTVDSLNWEIVFNSLEAGEKVSFSVSTHDMNDFIDLVQKSNSGIVPVIGVLPNIVSVDYLGGKWGDAKVIYAPGVKESLKQQIEHRMLTRAAN